MRNVAGSALVRRAEFKDLPLIAGINASQFRGNRGDHITALKWVDCLFRAFPAYQYFVVIVDGMVAGYIGWQIHGGFLRPEPVLELEQLSVGLEFENNGLGSKLIQESIIAMREWMEKSNPRIQEGILVTVWLYENNKPALAAYGKTFDGGVMGERTQYDGRREVMLGTYISFLQTP